MDVDSDSASLCTDVPFVYNMDSENTCLSMGEYIKSEITIEDEKITETKYIEFIPIEQIYQVEVGTVPDCAEELFNNIGEMSELTSDYTDFLETNSSEISEALNDHNYTSQEVVLNRPDLDSVREIILNQIVSNSKGVADIPSHISNFLDEFINKIKNLQLANMMKPPDESSSLQSSSIQSESNKNTSTTLQQNCSEPLEVEANDEYFENIYMTVGESKSIQLNTLLSNTKDFAKDFYNECNTLSSESEDQLKSFIMKKIGELKKIANISPTTDIALQTQAESFLKKRRRINHKAKKNLLDSSDSMDSDSERSNTLAEQKNDAERLNGSTDHLNRQNEVQDSIDLSKFIKIDINRRFRQMSCDSDSAEKPGSNVNSTDDDDTDKEIDRLTNLSGLNKRHVQSRPSKVKEIRKAKTLSKTNSNKLSELDEELEASDTDNSFKEDVDEVLTEREYLSRFNEQIKMQLLNESNSDSGLSDQSDYDLSKESSSTDNETKSDVVDKFLQVFQSEPDDKEEDAVTEPKEGKPDVNVVAKGSDSLDVSDELWNDNFVQKKRAKKSLEKLLAEVEKRNQNEEIVLSSESDYSDVEPEPVEEKSRIIKPMLRMDQLANETRAAQKSETERIKRLDKKHQILIKAVKNSSESQNNSNLILDYIEKTKTFIKVDEDIVKLLKPHQIDGLRFMYDSCYGGIDHTKKTSGSGCILAHCMGLGKTLQLIALLHTVITYKELNTSKVLVLCPKSTVMNWADELQRWLAPLKNKTHIKAFVFPDASDISDKLRVLEEWSLSSSQRAGCLLVGYEAFRTLVFYHSYKNRGNLSSAKLESIRDKVNKYLLQPGADLVVCDEGHIIKNSKSAISLAVAKIITPKRIILTGTPIQNNLKEYYSMVNFIKPLYLGTEKEFANLYANPIKNGQHKDSGKKDITVMKQRSYVLHKKLSKFVQRKEAELLKTFLPQKFEYVLFIPMTEVQNTLYEYILEAIAVRGDSRGKSLITDYTVLRKIWTHPKVLEDAWKNANMQKNRKDNNKKAGCSDDDQPDDIYDSQTGLISVTNDWWRKYLSKKDLETIMPSNKLRTMFTILRMCEEKGEKCLIFSAFVAVLNVVEYFFKKITDADPEILQHTHIPTGMKISNTWINGQDYYRLDGKTPKNIRHEMIKRFNSEANRRARVFLISAKAGGQGINLTGANRVIILDTSWNPSNDQQNIFRIFRLGQKKNCYIYRLIAMGTMEEKVYSRSVTKQAMSFRVVDEQQIDRHYNMAELAELYTLTQPKQTERPMPLLPKDTILAHLLRQSELVYKYHEHDSLLENKVEQELSEQEKADAWDTYERELQMNLAQQEGLTADKMPNAMLPKFPPYMGAVPGLDMQTLLNYSLQSASLIQPYNFGLSSNYLDTLNLYQKYSNMRYPDMSGFPTEGSYPASPFGVLSPPSLNRMPSNSPLMPNLPGVSGSKSHGRDFGLFDGQKSRAGSMAHSQMHHPLVPEAGSPVANATAANVLSSIGQYNPLLENPLTSLLNYSAQNYSAPTSADGSSPSIPSSLTAYAEKVMDAVENLNKKEKSLKKSSNDQNITQKLNLPQEVRSAPALPALGSVDLTTQGAANVPVNNTVTKTPLPTKKHQTTTQPTTTVDLTTSNPLGTMTATVTPITNPLPTRKTPTLPNMQRQLNMANNVAETEKLSKSPKTNNMNFTPLYAGNNGPSISKDFLKSTAEMQIIPTTSPPGTSSITKQLNEMSPPSISLTAVNTVTDKPKPRTPTVQKNNTSVLSTDNRHAANISKPNKKPVNPNYFSLSKAVDNVLTSMSTTKSTAVKEKSTMPTSYATSPVAATKTNLSKKPESLPSTFVGNLGKKAGIDSSPSSSKSLPIVHQMSKISATAGTTPKLSSPMLRQNIAATQGLNDPKTAMTVNSLGTSMPKKRSTESLKANLNAKRTKL